MKAVLNWVLAMFLAGVAADSVSPHVFAQTATAEPKTDRSDRKPTARKGKLDGRKQGGAPKVFSVDPGWQASRFPEHAVCYLPPEKIAETYANSMRKGGPVMTSFPKPDDGSLRIVATGHSFMAPGFKTLPSIARAGGFKKQGLLTHTGGGMTGSARYKWEQENGIFQFDRKPVPKLLCSIAGAKWDAMMWGPYYNDRAEYYACWIDFCLKYNPEMKFYLSDAWPQLGQLNEVPSTEDAMTVELVGHMHQEKRTTYRPIIDELNERYGERVFVLPTSRAMVLAVDYYHQGKLPGVKGIHKVIGGQERSLWRDQLGHLGPGLENLEGYVFYATLYGRSPELIGESIPLTRRGDYPSAELDRVFRKIAWEAVSSDSLSGIVDADKNGISDDRQHGVF